MAALENGRGGGGGLLACGGGESTALNIKGLSAPAPYLLNRYPRSGHGRWITAITKHGSRAHGRKLNGSRQTVLRNIQKQKGKPALPPASRWGLRREPISISCEIHHSPVARSP